MDRACLTLSRWEKLYIGGGVLTLMRMSSRTNPSDALERLAWTLNYHRGETVSINHLAELTDLSWATTQKYTQLLETLARIAPKVTVDTNGVTVDDIGTNLSSIWEQKDIQLIVYLLVHADIKGGPTEQLDYNEHYTVLHQYEQTIDRLEELGWLKRSGDAIQLTPKGVSIAGPARSKLRNTDTSRGKPTDGKGYRKPPISKKAKSSFGTTKTSSEADEKPYDRRHSTSTAISQSA